MKKNILLILSIALILSVIAASYGLFFADISEKRYNKIMCYYIARSLTEGKDTFHEKINAIRDFVNENVQPIHGYPNRLDTLAVEKLTSGIGWCDQASRVFMQLARSIGITSRLLFLRIESGSSPHSVAEAMAPDGSWEVVDTTYKDARANDPDYLAMYVNTPIYVTTKEGVKVDFLRFVPTSLIRPVAAVISERYIGKIAPSIESAYELKMFKARTYDLLGYEEKSEMLYDEIMEDSGDLALIRKAGFHRALLLKSQKRFKEVEAYIKDINVSDKTNPYIVYLSGLLT